MTAERLDPPLEADERATLTAFLDFQRATLALKCEGLTDDELRQRAVPPSSLSLLSLVRHMAEVERNWFRTVLGGEEMAAIFAPGLDGEPAFRDVADADVPEAFRSWHAECDHARLLGGRGAILRPQWRARAERKPPVLTALGGDARDRGIRAAQRACRPAQGAPRRFDRRIGRPTVEANPPAEVGG